MVTQPPWRGGGSMSSSGGCTVMEAYADVCIREPQDERATWRSPSVFTHAIRRPRRGQIPADGADGFRPDFRRGHTQRTPVDASRGTLNLRVEGSIPSRLTMPALAGGFQRNFQCRGGLEILMGALSSGHHGQYLGNPTIPGGSVAAAPGAPGDRAQHASEDHGVHRQQRIPVDQPG